ncbi:hypothetical protein NPX13_g1965 [Xylaria arbuscula]|uniref:Smr domain-containing protein n=1 Tax=Xylaria arbuscula TaxID=114810 RepID=A0A9W8NKY5_9PEZI|nr:hypothetical protein NPX13_g1965 [Xylaria arbuscula]
MATDYEHRPVELEHHDRDYGRLGGKVISRAVDSNQKEKVDVLRRKAEAEVEKKKDCMNRAHQAYARGDGATAKQLSNEGKRHAAEADKFFDQMSAKAFEINNPKQDEVDYIDLHGQVPATAVVLVTERIREDQKKGRTHLHVIVGKGIHSAGHIQKLKPAVENQCRELGLQYETEENEGRIFVNLQGGNISHIPPPPPQNYYDDDQQQYYPGQHGQHGQHHNGQYHGGQSQQDEPYDEMERLVKKLFKKFCCTVM